ncbi:mediator of rna polymerase ii transcription subunit 7 [Stemphylium lycopersici]|uniref:Mediator of RNA polymerase II transcription subunit 7 n=1 Tax=Stemphylium lycopersici TaxID=183478 RepID=A0A364N8E9_STELY|nr:mediator of rna polymerase ii transcription subunit 7 [Stemphylium lycopersici]RAR13594.1 mediator of rna polymerase ii transcription subunit 7 [Stemphylium lycopersici]
MDDPQPPPQVDDEDVILGFLPDPPPFYKHFTAENIARLKEITKEAAPENEDSNASSAASAKKLSTDQILALPTELRYLIPPEPPADDAEFHVFDTVAKAKGTDVFMKNLEFIADQLKMQGVFEDWTYEQLYPAGGDASSQQSHATNSASLDRQNYLFRFLRSILLSYISLLGIVAANPTSEQKDQKLKDIMTMVTNMHALINEYRPHQARQTLIERMEEQVRRKREEVDGVRKMGEKVREVLGSFGSVESDDKAENGSPIAEDVVGTEQARKRDAQRATWEALEDVMR